MKWSHLSLCPSNQRSGYIKIDNICRARCPSSAMLSLCHSINLGHLSYHEGIYRIRSFLRWTASPSLNLGTIFLLRGRIVTPCVMKTLNYYLNL
jgi:hypothetical protein